MAARARPDPVHVGMPTVLNRQFAWEHERYVVVDSVTAAARRAKDRCGDPLEADLSQTAERLYRLRRSLPRRETV